MADSEHAPARITCFQSRASIVKTAVELGSKLITKKFVAEENFEEIAQETAQVPHWIHEARGK